MSNQLLIQSVAFPVLLKTITYSTVQHQDIMENKMKFFDRSFQSRMLYNMNAAVNLQ